MENSSVKQNSGKANATAPVLDVLSALIEEHVSEMEQKAPRTERDKKADTKANRTALVRAIDKNNIQAVEELLATGMDPNFTVERTSTVVTPLEQALDGNKPQILELLLAAGARYDAVWKEYLDANVTMALKNEYQKNVQKDAMQKMIINNMYLLRWCGSGPSANAGEVGASVYEQVLKTAPVAFFNKIAGHLKEEVNYMNANSALHTMGVHLWVLDQESNEQQKPVDRLAQVQLMEQYLSRLLGINTRIFKGANNHQMSAVRYLNRGLQTQWKKWDAQQVESVMQAVRTLEEQKQKVVSDGTQEERGKLEHTNPKSYWVECLWKMGLWRDDLSVIKSLCQSHWYTTPSYVKADQVEQKTAPLYVSVDMSVEYQDGWRADESDVPNKYLNMNAKNYGGYNWKNDTAPTLYVPMLTYALKAGASSCAKVFSKMQAHQSALQECDHSGELLVYGTSAEGLGLLKTMGYPMQKLVDSVSGTTPLHYWCTKSWNKAMLGQIVRTHGDWMSVKNKKGHCAYEVVVDPSERKKVQAALEEVVLKQTMPARGVKKAALSSKKRL